MCHLESKLFWSLKNVACHFSYLIFLHTIFKLAPPLWALRRIECADQGWRKMLSKGSLVMHRKIMENFLRRVFLHEATLEFLLMFAMCYKSPDGCVKLEMGMRFFGWARVDAWRGCEMFLMASRH